MSFAGEPAPFLQPLGSYPLAIFKKRLSAIYQEIELGGAIAGKCSSLALLRACYAAERAPMAGNAIRKVFAACGIYPFSNAIIKELIKEKAGIMPRKAVEAKAKSAVSSAMQKRKEGLSNYGKKN